MKKINWSFFVGALLIGGTGIAAANAADLTHSVEVATFKHALVLTVKGVQASQPNPNGVDLPETIYQFLKISPDLSPKHGYTLYTKDSKELVSSKVDRIGFKGHIVSHRFSTVLTDKGQLRVSENPGGLESPVDTVTAKMVLKFAKGPADQKLIKLTLNGDAAKSVVKFLKNTNHWDSKDSPFRCKGTGSKSSCDLFFDEQGNSK